MKKIFCLCIIAMGLGLASCHDDKNKDGILDNNGPAEGAVKDLSDPGLANCYIVTQPGEYKFKADNQFNLGAGLPVPPAIHPSEAVLLWQSEPEMVTSVALQDENGEAYVNFEMSKVPGNALIAVCDAHGNVEWSWHIWAPEEEVKGVATSTGYEVMNMNLGALNNNAGDAASYGMLYQWGRKDPFPASATLTGDASTLSAPMYDEDGNEVKLTFSSWTSAEGNTIAYSIAHPMEVMSNYSQFATSRDWLRSDLSDASLWGNPEGDKKDDANKLINKGVKTCYDPSPYGWQVAPADVFQNFTTSGGYAWDYSDFNVADINNDGEISLEDYNHGWWFMVNDKQPLYFPAASRFDGSYAMLMGSMSGLWGNYWSNAPVSEGSNGMAHVVLSFQVKDQTGKEMVTVSPSASASRADGYSIRCVRVQ